MTIKFTEESCIFIQFLSACLVLFFKKEKNTNSYYKNIVIIWDKQTEQ